MAMDGELGSPVQVKGNPKSWSKRVCERESELISCIQVMIVSAVGREVEVGRQRSIFSGDRGTTT